ncbi:DUF1810 domain-containing protein [Spirosoma sp. KUDC1026]|uniref:DUF1810 domain-containing protein n=1 Tax=Spirosoma sp. KUDC1026 TaxID=2745947 RepID=UPI00159BC9D7|nr:DUF1810 domain-containing protein [Spirosoma sp. KUDC1026]QKZ12710.1 DUF1810 domain-containing protein [Spirosoma sp. KUDC1026]
MKADADLNRFLEAQRDDYDRALAEIKRGRKQGHWMWYIFPQLAGLGFSSTAKFYGIKNQAEASDYLAHPVLGPRLVEISTAIVQVEGKTANQILGSPDDLKLRSCMTLFSLVKPTNPVFQAVLDTYYGGKPDEKTLELVGHKS